MPELRSRAGIITHVHRDCQHTFNADWKEMVAAAAARPHQFDEKDLPLTLAEVRCHHGDGTSTNEALEEGWKQGVAHSMGDGIRPSRKIPCYGSSGTGLS